MILAAAGGPPGGNAQLAIAALLGIAVVVVLITWLKVHPFLSLIIGSAVLGIVAGLAPSKTVDSFTAGVGSTVGSVGLLIALGAMIGGLLADSGGADEVVDGVVNAVSRRWLPWAMALVAVLVGLPLFFEVGVVLLVPVILLVSRRVDVPLMRIGIPALAGLSVLHGLVPPHPGPLVAIAALHADLGLTLAFGLVIAIPTVILAGPVFGVIASRLVQAEAPEALLPTRAHGRALPEGPGADRYRDDRDGGEIAAYASSGGAASASDDDDEAGGEFGEGPQWRQPAAATAMAGAPARQRPAFAPTVATMLLPIVLMLLRAFGELTLPAGNGVRQAFDVIGNPVVALLAGVIMAMLAVGLPSGMTRPQLSNSAGAALAPIAGILLIVAAGGGFKQVLVDAGVGTMVGNAAHGMNLSPLILGWLVAVGIRLATGSATVATITAAGIVAPLAAGMDQPGVALLALAIGAGSLFFSHVNDAGFWLVKEYFGLSVPETLKTWSVMETIISVAGLVGVLALRAVV